MKNKIMTPVTLNAMSDDFLKTFWQKASKTNFSHVRLPHLIAHLFSLPLSVTHYIYQPRSFVPLPVHPSCYVPVFPCVFAFVHLSPESTRLNLLGSHSHQINHISHPAVYIPLVSLPHPHNNY